MSKKILKKLKEKEEKLMDAIYEIQELLDSTEDSELSSMGDQFTEALIDYVSGNNVLTLEDIRIYITEEYDG